jgi:hypothetical protein
MDLPGMISPYTGDTTDSSNFLTISCSSGTASDLVFTYLLASGYTINLQQTYNNYDSYHELRYGGDCPGETSVVCVDDPDYTAVSWTNELATAQRVYYVQSGFGSSAGQFTLTWSIKAGMCPSYHIHASYHTCRFVMQLHTAKIRFHVQYGEAL